MITVLGLALGAIFVVVPLCVAYFYRLNMCNRLLKAFVKLLLRVGVIGVLMHLLLQANSILLDTLCALFFIVYTAFSVVVKSRVSTAKFLLPVGAGMLSAVLICGSLLLVANVSADNGFFVRYVLPVLALLSGGMIVPVSKALTAYYAGLRHHNRLYYYLVGNGASRGAALHYLQRRAIESALLPGMKTMSTMAVGVSPMIVWTMIMCGKTAFEAAGWQLLVVLAVFCSSVVAVVVALTVARRYVIDGYANIKFEEPEADADAEEPTADAEIEELTADAEIEEPTADAEIEESKTNDSENEQI